MKNKLTIITLLLITSLWSYAKVVDRFPIDGAINVNPDTHLELTFDQDIRIGDHGMIRVFEVPSGLLVDSLDLSVQAGPTASQPNNPQAIYSTVPYNYDRAIIATNRNTKPGTPSGINKPVNNPFQLTIIGGFTDGFHFHPIILKGRKAVIYLHNNMLQYGKQYEVRLDRDVLLSSKGKPVLPATLKWNFTTKQEAPSLDSEQWIVSADGKGDFNTVQGALDAVPDFEGSVMDNFDNPYRMRRIFIKNGEYEELVYFRNKRWLLLEGESRDGVLIHYANNEIFNPHPADILTNEVKGTFPSRRAAFAADNCQYMCFRNLTLKTDLTGQAEGFLLNGEFNRVENVHIIGSGDALQVNGSTYFKDCIIDGGGDAILGRGPSFFEHCSLTSPGPFNYIRNTHENHGNVFLNCSFTGKNKGRRATLARAPINKGKGYKYAECVLLNCTLDNISDEGWGPIGVDPIQIHYWEYNSRTPDGQKVDISKRHPDSHQLNDEDPIHRTLIRDYSDYKYVLKW